jgi:hypothetical protein
MQAAFVLHLVSGNTFAPCLFTFKPWQGAEVCLMAQTSIPELDFTGTHGLGTEVDPNGQMLATYVQGTRASRLRDRLPGYCIAPAASVGQISGDGSIVLAIGAGPSQQGCFLANTTVPAPPMPELAVADFSGFGCRGCDGDTLVVGTNHQCAVRADQTVACWGKGTDGELGNGKLVDAFTPRAVADLTGVEQLAATASHTCARRNDGGVHCWGQNDAGQLGDGTRVKRAHPVQVWLPHEATFVAAGTAHSCAVLADQSVRCWGSNQRGQLGDGTTLDAPMPVAVNGIPAVTQVAAGAEGSCALTTAGEVYCWGNGSLAAKIEYSNSVTQISLNAFGYCFLGGNSDTQVLNCGGAYQNGGLNGPFNEWLGGSADYTAVSLRAGPASWCMRTANGLVACAGGTDRFFGEPASARPPVTLEAVPGGNGTCRLLPSGVIQCRGSLWGESVPRCRFDAAPVTSGYEPVLP